MTQAMRFDVSATDRASAAFLKLAENVERLEQKLRALDRVKAEPTVKLDTKQAERDLTAFEKKLQRTFRNLPKAKLEADVDGLTAAERKVDDLKAKMASLSSARVRVDVDVADGSAIAALRADLASLSDSRVRVDLDVASSGDLAALQASLAALTDSNIRVDLDVANGAAVDALFTRLLDIEALSPVRLRVEVDDQASTQLAAIQALADALAASSPSIQVDADTAAALAQLAGVATALAALGARATTVNVRLDAPTFLGQLARIQTELNTLAGGSIEIDADTRRLMTALAAARVELSALNAMEASPVVNADTELAQYRIRELEQELARIAGRQYTAKVDVDKKGAVAAKLIALVAASGLAVAGFGSLSASAVTLGGSLASLAGLAPLAVGGLAGVAAVTATLKVGLKGVSEALKVRDDAEKFNEALKELAPSAREFARTVRDIGPAWKTVQLDVQQRLFAGLGAEMKKLSASSLPGLKAGMGGIADQFNILGKDFVAFATNSKTVADVDTIFKKTAEAMKAGRPAATNLLNAFRDIAVVGTSMLPELAAGWSKATAKFQVFISEARQSGDLERWIQGGIDTLSQLGSIAGNVGSVLGSVFSAAKASGADFLTTLDRVTEGVAGFMRSGEGQSTLIVFFTEARDGIDALLPGLESLGRAAAETVAVFSDTGALTQVGDAFSRIADVVAPLLPMLGELGGQALSGVASGLANAAEFVEPLVTGLIAVVDWLGPIAPAVAAAFLAFKVLGPVNTAITTLGTSIATMAGRLGASEAATGRVASAFSKMGTALPILGAAFIGLSVAMDYAQEPADKLQKTLASGSITTAETVKQYDGYVNALRAGNPIMGMFVDGSDEVVAAWEAQKAAMSPLEKAQQAVTEATTRHNEVVRLFTANSPQAAASAADLALATEKLEAEQRVAGEATQFHTEKMAEQMQQAAIAADVDLRYLDSLDRITEAQKRATQAALDHKEGSAELAAANRDVLGANLDAAAAAGAKAEADAKAAGASNAAEIGAKAQKEEYLRLAEQATGPTKQALLDLANGTDTASRAAATAEIQARLHKDELGRLGGQATGPLAAAMATARTNFDTLGGANATAEQKARAQKDELQRLANMASGPLRTELQRMADQIRTLPDGDFKVTANGVLTPLGAVSMIPGLGDAVSRADGGVLPGYTPGRDPHQFISPTGGRLNLSGGEAVMRPEWTRAVGSNWVDAANKAARSGGVGGVASFIQRTAPRSAGAEGSRGDGSAFASGGIIGGAAAAPARFAMGGLIRKGPQPYPVVSGEQYYRTRDAMAAALTKKMVAAIKAEDARRAAAAAGGGAASGPITASAATGLNWARTQVGKPYVWGGVGPGGYDCSGFMSAILNVMRGRNPHARVGATGNFPWAGFRPGIGPGFNIGSSRGNPGHMAGTIGGTNVESSGSIGVRVGGGARGAGHSMFNTRAHIFDRGGMLRPREMALNLSGAKERVLTGAQNAGFERMVDMAGRIPQLPSIATGATQSSFGPVVAALRRVEVASAANQQVAAKLDLLVQTIERRGAGASITVNDRSGDPSETARSAMLAIRLS